MGQNKESTGWRKTTHPIKTQKYVEKNPTSDRMWVTHQFTSRLMTNKSPGNRQPLLSPLNLLLSKTLHGTKHLFGQLGFTCYWCAPSQPTHGGDDTIGHREGTVPVTVNMCYQNHLGHKYKPQTVEVTMKKINPILVRLSTTDYKSIANYLLTLQSLKGVVLDWFLLKYSSMRAWNFLAMRAPSSQLHSE